MPCNLRDEKSKGNGESDPAVTRRSKHLEVSLLKISTIFVPVFLLIAITTTANAKHRHTHHPRAGIIHAQIVCNERGCSGQANADQAGITRVIDANGNVVGGRPAGCPHAFCGCEASRYLFGAIHAELNLASNWTGKFPRTSPAPRMAAVRNHHVMVLISHVGGSNWLVHDGNSGGGLTRDHVRSVSGYIIVDPRGSRLATRLQ